MTDAPAPGAAAHPPPPPPSPPPPPPARGVLADARRLLPSARPQLPRLLAVLGLTVVVALAEGGQALLFQPLLNRVLLRGGADEDEDRDREVLAALPGGAEARDALALELGPRLAATGAPPPGALDAALAGLVAFRGRAAPAAWDGDPVCALLGRTTEALRAAARAAAEDAEDAAPGDLDGARARLLLAARLQLEAQAGLGLDPLAAPAPARAAAAARGLAARSLVHEATFTGAWLTLWHVLWRSLLLALALAVGRFGVAALQAEVVTRIYASLQRELTRHVLTLLPGQVQGTRQGDLLSRLSADVARAVVGVLLPVAEVFVLQPARALLLYALAVRVSPALALSLLGLAVIILVPILRWGRTIRRSARKRQSALGDVLEAMHQLLSGVRVVKVFRREAYEAERFRRTTEAAYRAELTSIRARTGSRTWMHLVNDVLFPLVAVLGGALVVNHWGGLDAGRFSTFAVLVVFMYRPLRTMAMEWNTLQDCGPSLARVLDVLDERPRDPDPPGAPALEGLREVVRLEGVAFAHPGGPEVLRDVTFEARAGTTTAIVGPTGAGKSTLLDLIARFLEPTRGRLLVDGRPLAGFTRASWLSRLALVAQDTFVFNDTIRENIRYGRLDATDDEVEEAARRARIHDEVAALPGGYDYVAGERGSRLSGGQVQRLTIARAILRDPAVLLLDEAMSALDARAERLVGEALAELGRGRTLFVVAHRLSTVRHADRIVVLGGGPPSRILEQGTHDELVAAGGAYAELVKHLRDPDAT